MPDVVLTAVGKDRPGIVDDLTGYLHELGANVADSSMINLRGQFAVILLAEADAPQAKKIADEAEQVGRRIGLAIDVDVQPREDDEDDDTAKLYRLKTLARDQPGIVHRVTHILHQHKVNIEELQTRLEPGAYGETPHFQMEMLIALPASVEASAVRSDLEALCNELNSTCDLQPATESVG